MSSNVMQQMLQQAQEPDEKLEKAGNQVIQALGLLYKEAYRVDPSGAASQAVQQVQQAVAEIVNNAENMGQQAPPTQDPFAAAAGQVMQAGGPPADPMAQPDMMGQGY